MKYRSILKCVIWLLVGLGLGGLIKEMITFIAIGLAIIAILIWRFFPRIANPKLENIRKQLEMEVLEVVTDAKYSRVKVIFKITNAQPWKVSIKLFSNTLINLDAEEVSRSLNVNVPIQLERTSTTIVAYVYILPRFVESIRNKSGNDKENWQFTTDCLLDTRWGEITWSPDIAGFSQSPRIGNIS